MSQTFGRISSMEAVWRGGSVVKSAGWSSRDPGSIPKTYVVAHKRFETSVPGESMSLLTSVDTCMQAVHCIHICTQT